MPGGAATWINSNASAPRVGDDTLAVAPETVFAFATASEMRACAAEIIAI